MWNSVAIKSHSLGQTISVSGLVPDGAHAVTAKVRIGRLGPQSSFELHPIQLTPIPPLENAPSALMAECLRLTQKEVQASGL
jgi:hypothetical protein